MKIFMLIPLLALLASCSKTVTGKLTDARGHYHGLSSGENYGYTDYVAKLSDLPACVVTSRGRTIYLTTASSQLIPLAAEQVKVRGKFYKTGQILHPKSIKVWQKGRWINFKPEPLHR